MSEERKRVTVSVKTKLKVSARLKKISSRKEGLQLAVDKAARQDLEKFTP